MRSFLWIIFTNLALWAYFRYHIAMTKFLLISEDSEKIKAINEAFSSDEVIVFAEETLIFDSLEVETPDVVMIDGAVAQPIRTSIYNPRPLELTDKVAFGIFAYLGTTAVTPDLIFYKGTGVSG